MNRKKSNGFTIFETMFALGLGVIILAGVFAVYLSAKKLFQFQERIFTEQAKLNFVTYTLWQNIGMAGYAGCANIQKLKLSDHTNFNFSFANALQGYDSNNLPSYLIDKVRSHTDVFVVKKANGDITRVTENVSRNATTIKVMQNPATQDNSVVLVSDCENADLTTATNLLGQIVILKDKLAHDYYAGLAEAARFDETAYFIGDSARVDDSGNEIYCLYMLINQGNKQELAEGVDNMQVSYGVARTHLNKVDSYLNADTVTKLKLWEKVLSVKILLHTQTPVSSEANYTIYINLRERNL
ncbi:MAG: PilW family protein [Gammaproteobacteria bacterium]|nr:PilW family protein [Gammaproteobacteria bacterium]